MNLPLQIKTDLRRFRSARLPLYNTPFTPARRSPYLSTFSLGYCVVQSLTVLVVLQSQAMLSNYHPWGRPGGGAPNPGSLRRKASNVHYLETLKVGFSFDAMVYTLQ